MKKNYWLMDVLIKNAKKFLLRHGVLGQQIRIFKTIFEAFKYY